MSQLMPGAVAHILDAIGNTPLVKLNSIGSHTPAEIYVKCEYLNPGGSMKDRIAVNIVDSAERSGQLREGGTIVEATSGNTGMGLALVAAVRGYKAIFVMPDKMSDEKIRALRAVGAKVVICPTDVEPDDPRSYYCVSRRLAEETPNAFYANQYHNPANPEAHYKGTGPEIWRQTEGKFDVFCAGMGTGGTLSGTGKFLKEKNPKIKIVGVDPIGSLYYEFFKTGKVTTAHPYKVEGIGEDFFPSTMNLKILDEVVRVTDKECFVVARELIRKEGILCGGSGGAAVAGAVKYAEMVNKPIRIIVHLPDTGLRYLSKFFNDDWMRENGYLEPEMGLGTVRQLLEARGRTEIFTATATDSLRHVISRMKEYGISQLPVFDGNRVVGVVTEKNVLSFFVHDGAHPDTPVGKLMEPTSAVVDENTPVATLSTMFNTANVVLAMNQEKLTGVITKIDLIEYMAGRLSA